MRRHSILLVFFLAVFTVSSISAQQPDSSLLSLERIFSSREFVPDRFGPARWLADGSGYTTLDPADHPPGGRDIVRYDTKTGDRGILVPATRLIPPGDSLALSIADYDWSPDGQKLLVFTNTQRVWRLNTRGDYWVLDLKNWNQLKKPSLN